MLTPEEQKKKREIFDAMSPRRQHRILQKGYENWNPFERPKEPPVQMKAEHENRQRALQLFQQFFAETGRDVRNTEYVRGVMMICEDMARGSDQSRGIYEFCCWYKQKGKE